MPAKKRIANLNHFMEKRVKVKLTSGRSISGELRGVDEFMSIVLYDAVDETPTSGTVENEDKTSLGTAVVRGAMIVDIVGLEV
ncbi:small nuclear ribonucleoprotein Sm-G [Trypanosoma equiperdum]|uniref:Sm protein G n=5 Tax=Trypanozoon TaxID=39700 RepID=Q382A6_TRYB2|nr:small nuclear ribonucleoprotein Sm-G [Trypanosoma brucei gambiense DAL972]XP_829487.1 small nuclear ribonucleoprotein Sm-G [Trypanosoma brucei brucei TREU927]AAG00460.1 Sm-G [Trypanosoma brucei]RHW67863.1 small nuclear ribonucleoprotein Sm-G [Trypanosoma brucei equiperdum]SCU68343.1 small nuclear ribonucleoprotein Sm-G [Trypanosoma equiperdum]EAN80375.1 small nuclear ribonucleoprotein Sm-G [Trypanosoma brucei brucei TREU927]CBH18484.1 small nuclear ribonucleoprotein Sm-G [Trypanosoma bruce|eukprot:XP_011780748.1 small nuclear ribonucleoprotein Sm-G [Trypanosoma brucei gambiense DAL972]